MHICLCVCSEDPSLLEIGEKFAANEDSLLDEMQLATSMPGVDHIFEENEKLVTQK